VQPSASVASGALIKGAVTKGTRLPRGAPNSERRSQRAHPVGDASCHRR
jgi:hypothetical protein